MVAAPPAAPVTAAGVTAEEAPAVVVDPAVGVAAAADAEDDEDDVVDDDASDVAPGTLSGAFGWPPSSGDGAILESVWRREIISGRQRRPPTCTGAPLPLKFASSAAVTAALSHFISEIYIISLHLLLLRAILLLLLASAATTSVSESVFWSIRRFLLLVLLPLYYTKLLTARSLPLSLLFYSPYLTLTTAACVCVFEAARSTDTQKL